MGYIYDKMQKMSNSFLQTSEWLDFQKSLGRQVWNFDNGKIRANIIRHDLPLGKNYLYIPHGPEFLIGDIQAGLGNEIKNFTQYLKQLGKEQKSIFIKMEPLADIVPELLYSSGIKLKRTAKHIQPQKTVILHLDLPEEELLSRMHHKTRYNIGLAGRKGLRLTGGDDIGEFWKLLKKTAKKDKFFTHERGYYEKLLNFFSGDKELKTKLYFVEHENKKLAAAIIGLFGDTAYYLHGAMDRDYRPLMAPYFMHWEIMKKLQATSYKLYDLWGVDSRKWPGVTRFKLGFGGDVVERPGSFDLPLAKLWYLVYKIARKFLCS